VGEATAGMETHGKKSTEEKRQLGMMGTLTSSFVNLTITTLISLQMT